MNSSLQLPDSSYRMRLTQAAESVGLGVQNVSVFTLKSLQSFNCDSYTPQIFEIELDEDQGRGGSRIRSLPLQVVTLHWVWQYYRGNKAAVALVVALATEALERHFDSAFDHLMK